MLVFMFGLSLAACSIDETTDATQAPQQTTVETTTAITETSDPTTTETPTPTTLRETMTDTTEDAEQPIQIRITVVDAVLEATLLDNPTSRDFISLLPITLTINDYAGTEKVSDLPRRLATDEASEGADPSIGDITYYAPWGNLAIFYRDFRYAEGLIELGYFESGVDTLAETPDGTVITIELATDLP